MSFLSASKVGGCSQHEGRKQVCLGAGWGEAVDRRSRTSSRLLGDHVHDIGVELLLVSTLVRQTIAGKPRNLDHNLVLGSICSGGGEQLADGLDKDPRVLVISAREGYEILYTAQLVKCFPEKLTQLPGHFLRTSRHVKVALPEAGAIWRFWDQVRAHTAIISQRRGRR